MTFRRAPIWVRRFAEREQVTTTAFITHRDCQLHDMGSHHPECPQRLTAINDHLIAQGIDAYFDYLRRAAGHLRATAAGAPGGAPGTDQARLAGTWESSTSTRIPR
jgi:hypothetical protein